MWNTDESAGQTFVRPALLGVRPRRPTYLPCIDSCACQVTSLPGMLPLAA